MKSRWDGVNQWQVIQSGGLTPEVKLFVAEGKSLWGESQTSCLREINDYWKQDACFDFSLQGEKGDGGEYGGGGRRDYK